MPYLKKLDLCVCVQRERDAGSRCIITMSSNSVSIEEPRSQHHRSFTFHFTFWSHSGFMKNSDGLLVPEDEGGRYADQVSLHIHTHTHSIKFSH